MKRTWQKMEENDSLSPKQSAFITELLQGRTITDASKSVGIGETTAYRWLKDPQVQQKYRDAQRAIFDESLASLMTDASKARATLLAIMQDTDAPHGARVRACQIVLEMALETHKIAELEAKIEEMGDNRCTQG